ncbi:MAG: proline--tRNA ligase, partial [Armatimonadetes bacterium]|nr:proline--tRNA ligase [Armatimonadota bacterium]
MKASQLYFPTLREAPSDADIVSHQLLVRGGFIRKLAAGVYTYLPLGWKVHQKIAEIVRQEMNRIGGQEILMPALVPLELLEESGRDKVPVLFHLKDRNERDFCLGFTHEEVIADLARSDIQSWRQMPPYLP